MSDNFEPLFSPEWARDSWYTNGITRLSDYTTMDQISGTSYAPDSYVYFIQCGNFIKIGRSGNPDERVKQLRRGGKAIRPSVWKGNPKLIGYVPGGEEAERAMQSTFGHLHDRGEWFRVAPELMERALEAQRSQARLEVAAQEVRRIAFCESAGIDAPAVDLEKITDRHLAELNERVPA